MEGRSQTYQTSSRTILMAKSNSLIDKTPYSSRDTVPLVNLLVKNQE